MTALIDDLRRWPDIEVPGLVAVDTTAPVILNESAFVTPHRSE
ncbi:hypothetical protein [Demequina sp. NBRC 110055]|nr:hypothetical protein [Demequina sp. NBRC 110055]